MTDIETLVYNWLIKHNIAFTFQSSLSGGIYELGGAVLDFLLDDYSIGLRVFGEYWHRGITKSGFDLIQKEHLSAMGLVVVDIWESDIRDPARLEQAMKLALQGIEML